MDRYTEVIFLSVFTIFFLLGPVNMRLLDLRWWLYGWCSCWIHSTWASCCWKTLNFYDGLFSRQVRLPDSPISSFYIYISVSLVYNNTVQVRDWKNLKWNSYVMRWWSLILYFAEICADLESRSHRYAWWVIDWTLTFYSGRMADVKLCSSSRV